MLGKSMSSSSSSMDMSILEVYPACRNTVRQLCLQSVDNISHCRILCGLRCVCTADVAELVVVDKLVGRDRLSCTEAVTDWRSVREDLTDLASYLSCYLAGGKYISESILKVLRCMWQAMWHFDQERRVHCVRELSSVPCSLKMPSGSVCELCNLNMACIYGR